MFLSLKCLRYFKLSYFKLSYFYLNIFKKSMHLHISESYYFFPKQISGINSVYHKQKAPKKHKALKTKTNLKKSISLDFLIKKSKLNNPTKKLDKSAGQVLKTKIGLFKNKYTDEPKITGKDIIYEVFKILSGLYPPKDKPKIVLPDLDSPGITDNPCRNPDNKAD